jgi:hypothetical protein
LYFCGSSPCVLLWERLCCFVVEGAVLFCCGAASCGCCSSGPLSCCGYPPPYRLLPAVDILAAVGDLRLSLSWLSWCNLQLHPPYLVCCRCGPSLSLLQVRPFLCVLLVKEEPPLCLITGALTCLCVSCVPLRSRPCLVNKSKGFMLPSSLSAV